jgi:hypothetical protein
MKNLSLKLDEAVYREMEGILEERDINRNRYINEAIAYFNKLYMRRKMASRLVEESATVYGDSMDILKEFEAFEDDPAV